MSTHSWLATMLPIPISIQGIANTQWKKQSFKTLKNIFKVFFLFLHSSTTEQTPQVSLPRQRSEHQSDLAKENPEKQELKI